MCVYIYIHTHSSLLHLSLSLSQGTVVSFSLARLAQKRSREKEAAELRAERQKALKKVRASWEVVYGFSGLGMFWVPGA